MNQTDRHTPEWQVVFGGDSNGFRYAIVTSAECENSHIATIELDAEIYPEKNRCKALEAANLIAAAPDLLAALKQCSSVLSGEAMTKFELTKALEAASAALSRARGEGGES